jgi:hypothetical protein
MSPVPANADPTLGTGASVGKYFSIVSVLPSSVFVAWCYFLFAAGSWSGVPSLATLANNNPVKHPEYGIGALVLTLAIAVIGHPAQFALVQLVEGYWGSSRPAKNLRARLVLRHLRRMGRLQAHSTSAQSVHDTLAAQTPSHSVTDFLSGNGIESWGSEPALTVLRAQVDLDAWAAAEGEYPNELTDVLPTRLGNRLRRYERIAGQAVHLPVLTWATHIGMVAKPEHTEYVNDQRTQLDLAVRMAALMGIATVLSFGLLWRDGWLLLLCLIPYVAAYVSYSGSIAAADVYGRALQGWVDLNRFRLYDELGLPRPVTSQAERDQNDKLEDLALGEDSFVVKLVGPIAPPVAPEH